MYYENTVFWAWITPFPTDSDWLKQQNKQIYVENNKLDGVAIVWDSVICQNYHPEKQHFDSKFYTFWTAEWKLVIHPGSFGQ